MTIKLIKGILFSLALILLASCNNSSGDTVDLIENKVQIQNTLETLLASIENKNIEKLKSTMSPSGKMELVVPNTAITYTVKEFVDFHEGWFQDTTWTMTTKILNIEAGTILAYATTEAIYREPERNGKPYENHMIVTYDLKKEGDKWYVVGDHASSLSKTKN